MASYLPNQLYQVPLAELQADPATGLVYVVAGERRCLKIVWEGQEKSLTIGGGMRDKATNTPATPLNDAHPGGYFYVR